MKKFLLFASIAFLAFGCSKPNADFTVKVIGTNVRCSAATSTADSYVWIWGDNTSDNSQGWMATHTYAKAGDYTITLSVDKNGKLAERSKRIYIP